MKDIKARFLAKVEKTSSCWNWTAWKNYLGYGGFNFNGKNIVAHRVSFQLFKGTIPLGMCVLHKCDNRKCVNPSHLFLGTRADNIKDMDIKGRRVNPIGELNGFSKLKEKDILEIRELAKTDIFQYKIAEKFNVTPTTISYVLAGKSWCHI